MSVCAKFQLSSWSRSGWKVCGGWGGWVGNTWLRLTPTLVALELFWVELSCVGFWQILTCALTMHSLPTHRYLVWTKIPRWTKRLPSIHHLFPIHKEMKIVLLTIILACFFLQLVDGKVYLVETRDTMENRFKQEYENLDKTSNQGETAWPFVNQLSKPNVTKLNTKQL